MIIGFALLAALAVWLLLLKSGPSPAPTAGVSQSAPVPDSTPAAKPSAPEPMDPAQLAAARLEATLTQLSDSHDPAGNRKLLADLRQFLSTLPSEIASRQLQAFLATGRDAATKLDVTLQPGGALDDTSSLRVFLLDHLGQIDRPAAGALAARILSDYTTPDEWAVSLRNYAWANPGPDSEPYLQDKARALLRNTAWLKNPSAGLLEAFDTIVHARGTSLTPDLATLARDQENRAAAHAAYLTLDRLTINQPAAMLQQFVEQPDLMQGREQTRANFLARADVREPGQRVLVEQYLLDPTRTAQELATFAGLYPNASFMISNNLLTSSATPAHDELIKHDAAALAVVREWLADARFGKIKPQIEAIRQRLETFVQQAAAGKQ